MDFMFPSTSANLTASVMVTELKAERRHMAQKGAKSKTFPLVVKAETGNNQAISRICFSSSQAIEFPASA